MTTAPESSARRSGPSGSRRVRTRRSRRDSVRRGRIARLKTRYHLSESPSKRPTPRTQPRPCVPRLRRSDRSTVPPPRCSIRRRSARASSGSDTSTATSPRASANWAVDTASGRGRVRSLDRSPYSSKPALGASYGGLVVLALRPLQGVLRAGLVDLVGQLGALGQDRDAAVGHGQEAPVHGGHDVLSAGLADGDREALGQLTEQRRVTGQDADLALRRAGVDLRGLAAPDLALDRDQLDVQVSP